MLNAQLHQLVLGNDQRVKFTVDFLFDGAWREKQVSDNRTHNTDHNLAAALHGKLRREQRFRLNGDDNNQRGITRQPPGVGVFHFHQRRNPGAETRPDTAHHQHQQWRADHQNNNGECCETADKRPDDTQHPTIADRARIGFPTRGKGRTRRNYCSRQDRPARGFKLEVKANKQRQHNGTGQLHGEANVLAGDGKDTHGD